MIYNMYVTYYILYSLCLLCIVCYIVHYILSGTYYLLYVLCIVDYLREGAKFANNSHHGNGLCLSRRQPGLNHVAYHWTHVDRSALLQYARQYEHAYEAMAAGDQRLSFVTYPKTIRGSLFLGVYF